MPTSIRQFTRAVDSLFRRSRVTMPHRTRQRLVVLTLRILLSGSLVLRRMASTQASLTPQTTCATRHERRLRRVRNDPLLTWERSSAPVAPALTARPRARRWVVINDATAPADQLRVVTAARWERGCALPLAGVCWPGPTTQMVSSWERWRQVRDPAAQVLPADARVVVGADRAFGGPVCTDPVAAHGWDGWVRGHGQTRWHDVPGRVPRMAQPVTPRGDRWNGAGRVCNDAGWRTARSVARWGRAHVRPWLLVRSLPRRWDLIALYRQRAAIATLFRDGTSSGWRWEARQVRDLAHHAHLAPG